MRRYCINLLAALLLSSLSLQVYADGEDCTGSIQAPNNICENVTASETEDIATVCEKSHQSYCIAYTLCPAGCYSDGDPSDCSRCCSSGATEWEPCRWANGVCQDSGTYCSS